MSLKPATAVKLVTGGICASGLAYLAYRLYKQYTGTEYDAADEGFIEGKQSQLSLEKKVLVIGLSGSGKTSIISRIAHLNTGSEMSEPADSKPTEGFNVTSVNKSGMTLNIWEIGGSDKVRPYWSNFLLDVDVLVFVVDSSDADKMPLAYNELHKVMGDDRLKHVPVVILANKQDLKGAERSDAIKHLLGLDDIPRREHDDVAVIATQIYPYSKDELSHSSIHDAQDIIVKLCEKKRAGRSRRR